ncbi:MAG: right-handed parallel beta-helix repeat-containing protein [Ignavibacteriales bacterium]|nr:right-handed parallel beta-helix repeat-containing protein [Ignavibacteriales bacterium]
MRKKIIYILLFFTPLTSFDFGNSSDANLFINRLNYINGYPRQGATTYCGYSRDGLLYVVNNKVADITDSILNANKTIYISNYGNDNNIGDSTNPIKSIDKLNTKLFPNSTIKFHKGDTFFGGISINADIEAFNINITSYGVGENPVIYGGYEINLPDIIWDSVQVIINDSSFMTTQDVKEYCIIRTADYIYEKIKVHSYIDGVLILNEVPKWIIDSGNYYFFINNYEPDLLDYGVYIPNSKNISVNDISFKKFKNAIYISNSENISIQNIEADSIYYYGIHSELSDTLNIDSCSFTNIYSNSINVFESENISITNNNIKKSGIYPGFSLFGDVKNIGISVENCNNSFIYRNTIDSTGYSSIHSKLSNNNIISNNSASNYGITKTGGGGLYTTRCEGSNRIDSNSSSSQLIPIMNASYPNSTMRGIHIDDYSKNVNCFGNTIIINDNHFGITVSNATNINVYANISTGDGVFLRTYYTVVSDDDYNVSIYNNNVNSGTKTPLLILNAFAIPLTVNNNTYIFDNEYIAKYEGVYKTIIEWQNLGFDTNSLINQ